MSLRPENDDGMISIDPIGLPPLQFCSTYSCTPKGSGYVLPSLLLGAVLLGAVVLARFCYTNLRRYWLTCNLPGPSPTLPFLGNLLQMLVPQEDVMSLAMDMSSRYGPTWRGWIGHHLAIYISEPDDLQFALTDSRLQDKSRGYRCITALFGKGLINIGFPSYKNHRKAFTPTLNFSILKGFIPSFGAHGRLLADTLQPLAESGEVFDAHHAAELLVCGSVCDTVFGSDMEHFQENREAVCSAVVRASQLALYLIMRPWFYKSDFLFRLLSPGAHKETKANSSFMHNFVLEVLEKKEAELQQQQQQQQQKPSRELLHHVLITKEAALIQREEVVDELKHVLGASLATTSDLMALLMLALALNPDVQDRVHQELDEVFADDHSREVNANDIPRLEYLEMTLKEVMRYFPLVPLYGRNASEDLVLPSGTFVPKGSTVSVFPKIVHWDSRWYPEPSKFDPDRFLPEAVAKRPFFAYIPFSAGARICLGHRYAMMLAKTSAATFLRDYRFLPATPGSGQKLSDLKLIIGMAMEVKGGVKVRVERRRQRAA